MQAVGNKHTFTSIGVGADTSSERVNRKLFVALALAKADGRMEWMIASQSGVSAPLLSLWKYGQRTPTRSQAERVAAVLGYPVDQLFDRVRRVADRDNEQRPAGNGPLPKTTGAGGRRAKA
jgi:hypothetical protein